MASRINIGPEDGPYVAINESSGNLQLEDNSGNVVAEWDETNAQWDFANNTLSNVDALNSNSVSTEELNNTVWASNYDSLSDALSIAQAKRSNGDRQSVIITPDSSISLNPTNPDLEFIDLRGLGYPRVAITDEEFTVDNVVFGGLRFERGNNNFDFIEAIGDEQKYQNMIIDGGFSGRPFRINDGSEITVTNSYIINSGNETAVRADSGSDILIDGNKITGDSDSLSISEGADNLEIGTNLFVEVNDD